MYKTGAVNFNIPSGQSYESMVIGGFKGIQYSDNPLAVDSDSASDMLNVYLSDSGTLTTRPRIEYLGKTPSDWEKIINRIKLTDEYVLYQVLINNVVHLYIRINSSDPIEVNLNDIEISKSKISAFYKDDKIYVLDGNYYVIKSDNKLYLVENDDGTYVPTTSINNIKTRYENNALNSDYSVLYNWDGHSDISDYLKNSKTTTNDYFKKVAEGEYLLAPPSNISDLDGEITRFGDNIYYGKRISNTQSVLYNIKRENNIISENDTSYQLSHRYVSTSPNGAYALCSDWDTGYPYVENLSDKTSKLVTTSNNWSGVVDNLGHAYIEQLTNGTRTFSQYRLSNGTYQQVGNAIFSLSDSSGDSYYGFRVYINEDSSKILMKYHTKNSSKTAYLIYHINSKTVIPFELEDDYDVFSPDFNYFSKFYYVSNPYGVFKRANIDYDTINKKYVVNETSSPTINIGQKTIPKIFVSDIGAIYYYRDVNNKTNMYFISDDTWNVNIAKTFEDVFDLYFLNPNDLSDFRMNRDNRTTVKYYEYVKTGEPLLKVVYEDSDRATLSYLGDYYFRFQNNYWFYGNSNRLWRTSLNDPTYIEEHNYIDVGNDDRITGVNILSDNLLAVYKANSFYLVSRNEISDDNYVYTCTETKGEVGNLPIGQTITTKYSELPLSIDDSGIFYISQLKNVTLSEHNTTSVSSLIDKKFLAEPNKESILTHNHRYWTYFIFPGDTAKVYVYDNRTNEWYYWELPEGNIISLWEENEVTNNGDLFTITKYMTSDGKMYALRTVDKVVRIDANNEYDFYSTYVDTFSDRTQEIEWFWESQILPLSYTRYSKTYPAIGYRKQLTHTGFLFTDTDENEEYSLDYGFKVYRKALSSVPENSISGTLNRVRSILRKTYIPRINFLQIKLKNSDLDYIHQTNLPNVHNKLNLIQLKFKYKLMEETV
jgi:hypothetical protein